MQTPDKNTDPKPHSRGSIGSIFLIIFIDLVGFSIVFPLFPAMLEYYLGREGTTGLLGAFLACLHRFEAGAGSGHFTPVLFGGLLGSLYSILQFVFAPVWGSLSDRFGRRTILLYTVFGTMCSYLLWFFSGSFLLFILARLLGGAMGGNLSVGSAAIADVTSRTNRAKGMALIGIAFGLGFTLGPAIGGLLATWNPLDSFPGLERFGVNPFSVPAGFAFLLALANLVGVVFLFRETLPPENRTPAGFAERNPFRMFHVRQEAPVPRTNAVYFLYILAFSGMEFTLTFLASQRFDFVPRDIGLMFVHIGFILIVTQGVLIRKLVPMVGEKNLTLAGLGLMVVAMATLAVAASVGTLYVGLTFMALGAGLTNPCLSALVSLYVSNEKQGETLGIFRSFGSLARAIGPLIASFIFWWYGSSISYFLGGALLLIPWALALLLPRPAK